MFVWDKGLGRLQPQPFLKLRMLTRRYPEDFDVDSYSFQGLFGYKVFVAMGLILGDGIYSLAKVLYSIVQRMRLAHSLKSKAQDEPEMTESAYAEGVCG